MSKENKISFELSPSDLNDIQNAIAVLQAKLVPHLINLTDDERQKLAKMKDKTLAFVTKATEHAEQNPTLVPAYIDVQEWRKDFDAVETLRLLSNPISQILKSVQDTETVSASEAYVASLTFYQSTKTAAKLNIQGAKDIYEDLKVRFDGQGKKRKTDI